MFKINTADNCLLRLEEKSFASLKLTERNHLQEWLAKMPDALGEELLIVQKEFDGFDETRERLDLLALDKDGQLVIIENKLDDTGRDVVWQALKYTAYCSNLNTAQIVEMFQSYLNKYCGGGGAREAIAEFLEVPDLEGVVLNSGNSQRIMLVAANFRKEVTATVLWLLGSGISMQCFKTTPYSFGEDLLLDVTQIIPTPEAEEFMINMSSKESEAKSVKGAQRHSHQLRLVFWERALESLRSQGLPRYQNLSPTKDHWLSSATGISGCVYNLIFSKTEARVELSFQRSNKEENKWLFDRLEANRKAIDTEYGTPLEWMRKDDKKSSRIQHSHPFEGFQQENWPEMIEWLSANTQKMEEVFSAPLAALNQELKSDGI